MASNDTFRPKGKHIQNIAGTPFYQPESQDLQATFNDLKERIALLQRTKILSSETLLNY